MNLSSDGKNNALKIILNGDYLNYDDNNAKAVLREKVSKLKSQIIEIDASHLGKWDSTLVVVLFELYRVAQHKGLTIEANNLPQNLQKLINLALAVDRKPSKSDDKKLPFFDNVGAKTLAMWESLQKSGSFSYQVLVSIKRFFCKKAVFRQIDWLFALEDCSYKAVGIISLVSFMVGLILAFVGAIQLRTFGAQIYVASLVAIGMTRIMGAIMAGVVMAGRTGASYAATIGTMQVNEEIDALKTMGIPVTDFLVLPRIAALSFTMPLLTILADFMGVLGGAAVGVGMLNISPNEYLDYTINALSLDNFFVGLFHALVYGIIISMCGCYFGIYCGRNADSVGKSTTMAVVSSIVLMIVATGIITLLLEVFKV
ncbi:MAG: ABC transporter permease [Alphaproteobacteria bacterium]|nr:ABC transporter permease [Alphaproteobacteria bacterium]